MGLKSSLTSLDRLPSLGPEQRAALAQHSVTTVEELAGMLQAEPSGVRTLLSLDEQSFEQLQSNVWSELGPDAQAAMTGASGQRYPLGALDPRER